MQRTVITARKADLHKGAEGERCNKTGDEIHSGLLSANRHSDYFHSIAL